MRWSSYRRPRLQKYSPLSCFPSCPAIRFTAWRPRFAWAVPFVWSCAGLAFDGVRGDAGDVHGRRARALASTRLCLAAQAAASSASRSKIAWAGPFLWSFAGLGRRGARGDAHDVPGRRARTLACAGTRRSSLHSPSHARRTHPQMHALMPRSRLLVGTLRCSCASLADASCCANATCRRRPKASTASTQANQAA
jgi:hypothetical protein